MSDSRFIDIADYIQVFDGYWNQEICENDPDKIFVFGDNEKGQGHGGQAIIRGCSNSIGLRTKRLPSQYLYSFWSDDEIEQNCKMIDEDINMMKVHKAHGYTIVLSSGCYGTGLSELPERAPETFNYLVEKLNEFCGTTVYDQHGVFVFQK